MLSHAVACLGVPSSLRLYLDDYAVVGTHLLSGGAGAGVGCCVGDPRLSGCFRVFSIPRSDG